MKFAFRFTTLALLLTVLPVLAGANQQWVAAGHKNLRAKKYDMAIRYYGGALKANPRNAAAAQGLGTAYYYKRDKTNALKYLKYALKLQPSNARVKKMVQRLSGGSSASSGGGKNYKYGIYYLKKKNYNYAARYLGAAAKEQPSNAQVWQYLGNAYYGARQKAKAVKAWDRACSLNPANAKLCNYVAKLKGSSTDTVKTSTGAVELPPGVPDHENMNYNPWVMGGIIVVLGAIMMTVF